MRINLPYIRRDRDRHGNLRIYVRVPGKKQVRIHAQPGTPEFLDAYRAAIEAARPQSTAKPRESQMTTRVYGCSDDLIEFEGDVDGEVWKYISDEDDPGSLLAFSDGTLLAVRYGKPDNLAIWAISIIRKGDLFERIGECVDEDADPYSDQAFFRDGLQWAYAATTWERVR